MDDERQYFDRDGKPCSLDALCQKEPGWAANRIRAMEEELETLSRSLRARADVGCVAEETSSADRCNCGHPEWCGLCIDDARRKAHGEFIAHLIEPTSVMVPEPEWVWVNVYVPGECEWYAYPSKALADESRSEGGKTFAFTRGHELERRLAQWKEKIDQLQEENRKLRDELANLRHYEMQRDEVVLGSAKQWSLEECGRRCTSLWKSKRTESALAEYLLELDACMFFTRLSAGQTTVISTLNTMATRLKEHNDARKAEHADDDRCKRLMEQGWDDATKLPEVLTPDPEHFRAQVWIDVAARDAQQWVTSLCGGVLDPASLGQYVATTIPRHLGRTVDWVQRQQRPLPERFDQTEIDLGRLVRETWVQWARRQPDVGGHPNWMTPWEALPNRDKEVDCLIAKAVADKATQDIRNRVLVMGVTDNLAKSNLNKAVAALHSIMSPSCVECGSVLVGPWDPDADLPPHCEGCTTSHEQDADWDQSRKRRLALIDELLDLRWNDKFIVSIVEWGQRFKAPCGCVCLFGPHLEVVSECVSHVEQGTSWIFKQ